MLVSLVSMENEIENPCSTWFGVWTSLKVSKVGCHIFQFLLVCVIGHLFFVLIADEDLFEFNFFARTFQKFVETSKANHILKSKRAEMLTYWIAKLTK